MLAFYPERVVRIALGAASVLQRRCPRAFMPCAEEGEIAVLDHVLKFMTLGTLIVSSIAIYTALHTNNRRLGADIFLKYSDRVSNLRRSLPTSAFLGELPDSSEMTPEERRAAHEIIHSIFEL